MLLLGSVFTSAVESVKDAWRNDDAWYDGLPITTVNCALGGLLAGSCAGPVGAFAGAAAGALIPPLLSIGFGAVSGAIEYRDQTRQSETLNLTM
jgi:hypothetical protein